VIQGAHPKLNGGNTLIDCLHSVFKINFHDLEVILVGKWSKDGSPQKAQNEFPSLKVLCLSSNPEYGKSVNRLMAASIGKYIGLLDNDVVVSSSWLSELLRALKQDPTAGIVGSKVYFASSEDRIILCAGAMVNQGLAYRMLLLGCR
jgi:GT2 family glycosyltransferase